MSQLLSVSEAQERLFRLLPEKSPLVLPLNLVNQLTLAQSLHATSDLPPFANSSMDGFAVRSSDITTPPTPLLVVEDIPAGHLPQKSLRQGQASRVMTGAPIPPGADAIVPLEETDQYPTLPDSPMPSHVTVFHPCEAGQYIRPQGQDIHEGQVLFQPGHVLTPPDIGLIASCGVEAVHVIPRPRIALFSSGDELIPPGSPLSPGKIYDSNQVTIAALLTEAGAEVIPLGIAQDNQKSIDSMLSQALETSPDIIVSTAGVSVGAYDYIRQRIELAGHLDFWRVNMRPGKPIAVGDYRSIPFIGLPGNPVSAYIGSLLFLLPAVRRLGGSPDMNRKMASATLEEDVTSDGRESYLRSVVTKQSEGYKIHLAGHQGSANLFALTRSNALLIVPSGVKSLAAGEKVNCWLLTDPENGSSGIGVV